MYVFIGNGDGSFKAATSTPGGYNTDSLALADMNGDGRIDIISNYQSGLPALDASFGSGRAETTEIPLFGAPAQEITKVTPPTTAADITGGQYFSLYTTAGRVNFYFVKDGVGDNPNLTGENIAVNIDSSFVQEDIAIAIEAAASGATGLTAIAAGKDVFFTNTNGGSVADGNPGNVGGGFAVTVDVQGTNSALSNSSYFTINSPSTSYYVWYNIGGTGVDPALEGKTAIEVALNWGDSATAVAAATASAIDALPDFIASADTGTLTITNAASGQAVNVGTGNISGLAPQITQQGDDVDVDVGTDTITLLNHEYQTGDKIRLSTAGTLPGNLLAATDYYVIAADANRIKLAASYGDAIGGIAIDITSVGTGDHQVLFQGVAVPAQTGVAISFGNGDGSFSSRVSLGGDLGMTLAVADFNADGRNDISISTADWASFDVLLANGDGSFQAQTIVLNSYLYDAHVVDINADGKLDILGLREGKVYSLLGNGDGTFGPAASYDHTGSLVTQIHTADLNNDGHLDLLVPEEDFARFYLKFGNGDGSFAASSAIATEQIPIFGHLADFNGDEAKDILMANQGVAPIDIRLGDAQTVPLPTSGIGRASSSTDPLTQDLTTIGGALVAKTSLKKLKGLIKQDTEGVDKVLEGLRTAAQFAYNGALIFDSLSTQDGLDPESAAEQAMTAIRMTTSTSLLQLHSGLDTGLTKELLIG